MVVRRLLAALLFLPMLVSCSDDDPDPPDTGDPTAPVTSHPTPTETPPPTEPPEAGERTKAGAEAFVEHWVVTLNYAAATGETSTLRRLGLEGCESCSEIADLIDDVYEGDGRIEGEGWEVSELQAGDLLGRRQVEVQAHLVLHPQVIRYGDGTPPDRNSGLPNARARFALVWTAQGWQLRAMYQGVA